MLQSRSAGVLLPVAALPGARHCGDFGRDARRFVDQLAAHGFTYWQLLPLHPTHEAYGFSPYSAQSCFAVDECYLSVRDLLSKPDRKSLKRGKRHRRDRIDYASAKIDRATALDLAFSRRDAAVARGFAEWRKVNAWVEDYATWRVLADEHWSITWTAWPKAERRYARREGAAVDRVAYGQYILAEQWRALKAYANERGVRLFGDLPIYPHLDSADVWAHRDSFKLSKAGKPRKVAGVPPDYFSADGQLWGNPVYDWPTLAAEGFTWWVERVAHALRTYDLLRLDHFIGLVRAYEVGASAKTARRGRYVDVPTDGLFAALQERIGALAIVAEDLGADLPAVRAAMARWALPGMRVLQFGFGDTGSNPHLPHNYEGHSVAYTGTHDNDTARGWYAAATKPERKHFREYVGGGVGKANAHEHALRLVMRSVAALAIVPAQDLLGLPSSARTNTPGTTKGNWRWRAGDLYSRSHWQRAGDFSTIYGRRAAQTPFKTDL